MTINFPTPETGDELAAQRTFQKIRVKCRSWLDYKRKSDPSIKAITDTRTWENCSGILHVNWMIHIPSHLEEEFLEKLGKWISMLIPDTRVGTWHRETITNLNGLLKYVLKGADPAHAWRCQIDPKDQGEIWGRRTGASISLGKTARKRDWDMGAIVQTQQRRSGGAHRRGRPVAAPQQVGV